MIKNNKQRLNHQAIISIKTPLEKEGLPLVTLDCKGVPMTFLVDTGSSHCLITKKALKKLSNVKQMNSKVRMYGVDGKVSEVNRVMLSLTYKGYDVFTGPFTVADMRFPKTNKSGKTVDTPSFHGILGFPFLHATGTKINYTTLKVHINGLSRHNEPEVQELPDISLNDLEPELVVPEIPEELAIRLGDDGVEPTL